MAVSSVPAAAKRMLTLLVLTLVAAFGVVAVAGPASAAPGQRGDRPAVSVAAVFCGYYDGNATTRRGNVGNRVREIQCLLIFWGYNPGAIDGDFGPNTESAVRAFQADTFRFCDPPGLVVDGIVGPNTWRALRNGCP